MKTQYGEICCRLTFGWIFLRALSAAPPPAQNYRSSWWKTTAAHPKDVIWPPKMLGFHGEVEIRRIRGNGSSSFNRPCEQKLGIRFDQSNRNKQMLRCFIVIWSSDDPLILLTIHGPFIKLWPQHDVWRMQYMIIYAKYAARYARPQPKLPSDRRRGKNLGSDGSDAIWVLEMQRLWETTWDYHPVLADGSTALALDHELCESHWEPLRTCHFGWCNCQWLC